MTNRIEEVGEAETKMRQHQNAQKDCAAHQQHGLDDLYPGGRQHSAKNHIDNHQHPDTNDRCTITDAGILQQQSDQRARADHLGNHVEDADSDRAERGHRAHGPRTKPISQHVGHRIFPGIAQRFSNDQEHSQVCNQPPDGIHESVVALERDDARDAQERRGAHVIAGDRKTVLPSFDLTIGRKKGARAARAPRRPVGDQQRDADKEKEHREGHCHPL